jgi:hypothetical protein
LKTLSLDCCRIDPEKNGKDFVKNTYWRLWLSEEGDSNER